MSPPPVLPAHDRPHSLHTGSYHPLTDSALDTGPKPIRGIVVRPRPPRAPVVLHPAPPQAVDTLVDNPSFATNVYPLGTHRVTEPTPSNTPQPDLDAVWAAAVSGLSDGVLSPQHRAWVGLTRPLGLVENTALLAAPNEFAKDVLDSRLRGVIAQALSEAYGREIRIAVTVAPNTQNPDNSAKAAEEPTAAPQDADAPMPA